MPSSISSDRPQVFLSYSRSDQPVAEQLASYLEANGYKPWLDVANVSAGDPIETTLGEAIRRSDYFVVLVSAESEASSWASWELTEATLPQHRARNLGIVPVLRGSAHLPPSLDPWQSLRVPVDEPVGPAVADAIQRLGSIDFASLGAQEFETLVGDLLPRLGFTDVESNTLYHGRQYDFQARLPVDGPFRFSRTEDWMIEVKHHRQSRVSTTAIADFAASIRAMPVVRHAAILTSGTLTSAAREFLEYQVHSTVPTLQVVEGDELRYLVARFPDLVKKYFDPDDVR